jgi:hypothetical protein
MSANMIAASLRCSVFSDGMKGLEQIVAERKQQSVHAESGSRGIPPIHAECESAWVLDVDDVAEG